MGVDGFRLDAARHLIEDGATSSRTRPRRSTWLQGFRDAGRRGEAGRRSSSARSGTPRRHAARYVREGALDLAFDFGLASQILSAVRFGDPASLAIVQAEVARRLSGRVATPRS